MDNSVSAVNEQDTSLVHQNDSVKFKFEGVIKFVENKVISSDGLTLAEVFQALVQILSGDLESVKKVLAHASIMAKHGMELAKESQLSRADVLRILEDKENVVSKQRFHKEDAFYTYCKTNKEKMEVFFR